LGGGGTGAPYAPEPEPSEIEGDALADRGSERFCSVIISPIAQLYTEYGFAPRSAVLTGYLPAILHLGRRHF
jgi:hypothetical protein